MSATSVRAQMQAFLAAGNVPHVNRWYADEPWFIAAQQFNLAAGSGAGAVAWPHITDESERRITLGAVDGQKEVRYQVSIVMLYVYAIPSSPGSEDAYVASLDAMIDGLKARLRSDPKAGTAAGLDGVIFQQSQEDGDLHVIRDLPILDQQGGSLLVWQRVDTTVTEIITA